MKKIRLDIEYPKREFRTAPGKEPDPNHTPQQVSFNVIGAGISLKYGGHVNKSMSLKELRLWSKIQDKIMDENGKPLVGEVELSDEQFEFLYDVVTSTNFPPSFATGVATFSDYLDQVKVDQKDS